eukprot:3125190-Pyramimonas_sp.AAC.1
MLESVTSAFQNGASPSAHRTRVPLSGPTFSVFLPKASWVHVFRSWPSVGVGASLPPSYRSFVTPAAFGELPRGRVRLPLACAPHLLRLAEPS